MTNSKNNSQQAQAHSLDNHRAALEERGELAAAKKRIEARIKQLDEELRPVLADRGKVVLNGYAFEVKSVAGRTTYDTKRMIEDGHGNLLEDYKRVGAPSTRFMVEVVNEL